MLINYKETIQFKLEIVNYHSKRLFESMDIKDTNQLVAVTADFSALMLTYQSIFDLVAQEINQNYKLNLDPNRLYFHSLNNHYYNHPQLRKIIPELLEWYKYINDFCNTIKHQRLIEIKEENYFLSPSQIITSYRIKEFKKKGVYYPSKTIPYYTRRLTNELNPKINIFT